MPLRHKIAVIGLFWLTLLIHSSTQAKESKYIVLNYHDVKDHLNPKDDSSTISTDMLVAQFNFLKEQGYNVIGMDDVIAAKDGTRPFPHKAVMLTFDDGYASFYERVLPLLKAFKFKAVQALIGKWHEQGQCTPSPQPIITLSGGCRAISAPIMTWEQLHEVVNSGLVEIASHTYDLHRGISADPQADELPSSTSLFFDPKTKQYESQFSYHNRVLNDLIQNNVLIKNRLGVTPRVIVWPYGSHNADVIAVAKQAELPFNMVLADAFNSPSTPSIISRYFLSKTTDLDEFRSILEGTLLDSPRRKADHTRRAMHVDLDYLYDANPEQQKRNLDNLIERVYQSGANMVFLQAFSDVDGDGAADSLYFPNRYMPVRANLFTHVAWRLRTRLRGVRVYAWMPVLAFHLPKQYSVPIVKATTDSKAGIYHRLSPFSPKARELILDLYDDLSRHAHFDGIIFHDDATLNDYEDASDDALKTYKQWGFNGSIDELRTDPQRKKQWARSKTTYLNNFTLELAEKARYYQESDMPTARNIYALPVLNPNAEEWYAQSLDSFLKIYNYTAIMAMPYMEDIPKEEHEAWLIHLAKIVSDIPDALPHTIFELQTLDWKTKKPIPTDIIANQMFTLHKNGILNLAYYPDDFLGNHPDVRALRRYFGWQELYPEK